MRIINKQQQVEVIKDDFKMCEKVFLAIGNETRQSIITVLMETTCTNGLRVGEITEQTHLSRPAVSHHLRILREAGITNTKNTLHLDYEWRVLDESDDH